jgi:hypothetical protein
MGKVHNSGRWEKSTIPYDGQSPQFRTMGRVHNSGQWTESTIRKAPNPMSLSVVHRENSAHSACLYRGPVALVEGTFADDVPTLPAAGATGLCRGRKQLWFWVHKNQGTPRYHELYRRRTHFTGTLIRHVPRPVVYTFRAHSTFPSFRVSSVSYRAADCHKRRNTSHRPRATSQTADPPTCDVSAGANQYDQWQSR